MLLIHWVFVFTILSIFTVMWWCRRFPSVDTVQQLATIINSRGGNILWLGIFSMVFFFTALRYTYWVLNRIVDGKIDATNAIVLAGFTFITGSAFGGAFTSMVKAMTGEVPAPPSGGTSTLVTQSSTSAKPTPGLPTSATSMTEGEK